MKIKNLLNTDEKTKEILQLISTVFGIIAVILTAIVLIYQFGVYLFEIQWFNYWGINEEFYVKNSSEIINGLIYGFSIVCILIIMSIAIYKLDSEQKSNKKDWIAFFIFFFLINGLLGIKMLYRNGFSFEYVVTFLIATLMSFFCIKKFVNSTVNNLIKIRESKEIGASLQEMFLTTLITIIIIFALIIIWGNVDTILKKEYMIIKDGEDSEVILYASEDYYIVSKCIIDNNKNILKVYYKEQRKIDNNGINYRYKTFDKVKKDE